MAKDEEREFRLRPRKPAARNERAAWASAYKIIMHYARMTSRRLRQSAGHGSGPNRTRTIQPAMRCPGHLREECNRRAMASTWALRRARERHA